MVAIKILLSLKVEMNFNGSKDTLITQCFVLVELYLTFDNAARLRT